jgi:flagellar biogenesis protein FliO
MNLSFRKLMVYAAGLLILSGMLAGQNLYAQGDTGVRSIGKFDINKVRELSNDPRTVQPQTGAITTENVKKETANLVFTVLRIIGSLALIIALVFAVSWLIRRSGLTGTSRIGGGGTMDILEVLPLGQNRNAVLFRVMDTVYLCSQTPSSIALIDKIEGQRAVDLLTSSKGTSTVVKFKDAFSQFVSRIKK